MRCRADKLSVRMGSGGAAVVCQVVFLFRGRVELEP